MGWRENITQVESERLEPLRRREQAPCATREAVEAGGAAAAWGISSALLDAVAGVADLVLPSIAGPPGEDGVNFPLPPLPPTLSNVPQQFLSLRM